MRINPIEVQKYLKGVAYPANRQELLVRARQLGASDRIRSSLEKLPDSAFDTPTEVSQALGRLGI